MKPNQLKAARALLGMNQGEFADLAGVSESTIQRFESMEGEIEGCNLRSFRRIIRALKKRGLVFQDDGVVVDKNGELE